jgi:DNA-damage-inducible protein J
LKTSAENLFEKIGMNLSSATVVFFEQAVQKGEIPFNVETDSFWSKRNQTRLEESRKAAEAGILTEHELVEVDKHIEILQCDEHYGD